MNFLMIFIAIANVIAVALVYFSFGKNIEKQKKVFYTMIAFGFMYIFIAAAYFLSSIGLKSYTGADTAKTLMTMAFVPVNTIIIEPFIIYSYMKMKDGTTSSETLKKRVIIFAIIGVIMIIGEFVYFRDFQNKLIKLENETNKNSIENTVSNNMETKTNTTNNIAEKAIDNIINSSINNTEKNNVTN